MTGRGLAACRSGTKPSCAATPSPNGSKARGQVCGLDCAFPQMQERANMKTSKQRCRPLATADAGEPVFLNAATRCRAGSDPHMAPGRPGCRAACVKRTRARACSLAAWGLVAIAHILAAAGVLAQQAVDNGVPVRVYVDCQWCDFDYIRSEIRFVDYVRDPEQADLHVFITSVRTGLQGRQYEISFLGRGDYASIEYTFERQVDRNATRDETRTVIADAIRLGLTPYVAQGIDGAQFALTYGGQDVEAGGMESLERDPWNHWVFTLYGGDFELEQETNRTVFDSRWGFYADHVSEDWKFRIRPYFNYDLVIIKRENRDDVRSSITRHGLDSYAIASLGQHWSAAVFGDYITRNDRNLRHWARLMPGVEYSFLPYELATRRAVTLVYRAGYTFVDYFEETIFGKSKEQLGRHELRASVAIRQPWGDVFGGMEGGQYLHDLSKRRAEFFGSVSVRLLKGLSVSLEGQFEMIRDQLSLPAGDASLAEILLQQRELATDYDLSVGVAFTYTMGSEFANVVNTRF